jgi:hypothetical protein
MSEVLVTVLEDVLMVSDVRIERHCALFSALGASFRTVILSTWPRPDAQRALRLNHLRYDNLVNKDDSVLDTVSWKLTMVREIMGMGWPLAFYLDSDPVVVREVFALGVTTLLLTHRALRPAWLPSDEAPRAWEDLVAFQEAQDEHVAANVGVNEVGGDRTRRRWSLDE